MKLGKKILLMLGLIFLTTIIAAGVYVTDALNFSNSTLSKTFKEYGDGKTSTALQNTKPFSVLLMGVDTGSGVRTDKWSGNSDSMILVTVNPETKQTTMTSLERDVLINITNDGETYEAKLNAAYAAGGAPLAISTVQSLLDIKIDYYMQINMQGLMDLVDAVGGIKVTNNFDFPISIAENEPEYTATVAPGTHLVNGEQALVFARMRYDDPEGDYGRQKRQREVIQKVTKKLLNLNSITSYKKILEAVSNNMQTNIALSTSTIPQLLGYSDSLKHITEYQLKGEDATLNGGSYQIATTENLMEIQNNIKKQLGLKEATADTFTTSAVLYETLYGNNYSTDTSDNAYSSDVSDATGTVTYDDQADTSTYGYNADTSNPYTQSYQ
ncbi:biofilm formation/cell division transcriptional regulator BrpA [Streptococcus saliviloxodontae]|uniref:LCP family protein required for cell wall assembly n=1 Tax=Streptococcus saliviloxodontae TaxID=1349416 RepID=A0ABS2PN07_9STRE|nr:LCP family protein [Streptococcus saliviloxodontae]MBM7636481.1 LCP family protein required for cell wall assembly [Streptococcus saliviloxodontae]